MDMKFNSFSKLLLLSLLMIALAFAFCSCDIGLGVTGGNSGDNNASGGGDNAGDNTGDNTGDNAGDNSGNNGDSTDGNNGENGDNSDDTTDDNGGNQPETLNFTVTVLDSEGNAEKKIIAYLYNGNSSVKSVPLTNGKAAFSNVASGEYRVVLKDMTNSRTLVYDESSAVLNADNRDITITVYNKLQTPTESVYFLAEDMADALAFPVKEGTYSVDVKGVAYFVLRASKAGIYTITASASSNVTVVNYGNPQIANRISEGTNVVTIDVPPIIEDEVTPFVIAVESAEKVNAIVRFERTGDSNDPAYMPWSDVEAEDAPSSVYSLPAGTELVDLDVFSDNLSVTLGSDGYYYTADGKLVLIRINSDAQYLGVSIAHLVPGLVESSEAVETFGLYLYDDDGNFLRKENYGTVIAAYYEKCDAELGVVPLTEELADIIKIIGDARGWWDYGTETGFYIFGEDLVNEDIAWLFACCVAK